MCEPPFGSPHWPETEVTTDPRWEFGIPAPRDGELAWVQHCYAHLLRGASPLWPCPSGPACSTPEGIRAALIRSGVLRVVIALPRADAVPGTDLCLWLLRRPYGEPDHGPVRMIDLSGLGDAAEVPASSPPGSGCSATPTRPCSARCRALSCSTATRTCFRPAMSRPACRRRAERVFGRPERGQGLAAGV